MLGLTICAISDTLAAIIGIKYGKLMLKNKSLEGCLAFFLSSFIICYLMFGLNYFFNRGVECLLVASGSPGPLDKSMPSGLKFIIVL